MKKELVIFAAVLALGVGSSAHAASITLADEGVVGAANWLSGDNDASYAPLAEAILDLGFSASVNCGTPARPCRSNTVYDYSGDLSGVLAQLEGAGLGSEGSNVVLGAAYQGYEYAVGKYDGTNAGLVLFYLPDYGYTIPGLSDTLWTNTSGEGYALSNLRFFNATSVPDGGSVAVLLGMAILGLAGVRRWLI